MNVVMATAWWAQGAVWFGGDVLGHVGNLAKLQARSAGHLLILVIGTAHI